jgi:tetratricopeptide (TPR) repeat protein
MAQDTAAWRREMAEKYGALTLDTFVGQGSAKLSTCANALYKSLADLLRVATSMLELDPTASYYAYHSGRGVDLVVSLAAGRPVATWGGSGAPIERLSAEEERTLLEDAALRNAAGTIEVGGIESAYEAIQAALAAAPKRAELMQFARQLVTVRKFSIAGQLVDARLKADPNDAWALLLDAKMTMTLVNSQQWEKKRLVDAERSLSRVLSLAPDWVEAWLLWCDIPRFGGDASASVPRFLELLRRKPQVDIAHYNLAAIYLSSEPARALEHLVAGERLAPQDADYPFGAARALLALERLDEARAAFQRGVALDPKHRLVEQLEARLG